MKIIIFVIAFLSLAHANSFDTELYQITFTAKVQHIEYEVNKAIRYQVVHSLGPGLNKRLLGQRSSLNYKYKTRILSTIKRDEVFETTYEFSGQLLAEKNVDLNRYKIILPVNSENIFDKAKRYKHFCSISPYRGIKNLFYFSWSPKLKHCGLKKNQDYIEVSVSSFMKKNDRSSHLSEEFLINGEYKLFYYYGSDYFSMRRFGQAANMYSSTISLLKSKGLKKIKRTNFQKEIFGKTKTQSRFIHMRGTLKGKPAEAFILLGNPTDKTPLAKREFFDFTKYALENGSAYSYAGHAGLGSVFNLDLMEEEYGVKINYLINQKQFLYIDGCNTFFYSSNFFLNKKPIPNTLVLITNGASILTNHYKQAVHGFLDLLSKDIRTDTQIQRNANYYMRRQGASKNEFALVYVLSN